MRRASAAKVNEDGRAFTSAATEALVELREAAATFLRYMGSVDEAFERGDVEVAQNVLGHQRRNLRQAIEKTGPLTVDGYAGRTVQLDVPKVSGRQGAGT